MLWLSLPIAKADNDQRTIPEKWDGYKKAVWASPYSVVQYPNTIQPFIEAINMNFSNHLPTLFSLVCGLAATANALPLVPSDKGSASEHSTRAIGSNRRGRTTPIPTWAIVGIVVVIGFALSIIIVSCCCTKRRRAAEPPAYLPPATTQPSAPQMATVQPINSFPVVQEPPPAYTPSNTSGGVYR
ncbi:unnamed protein product [Clonostachys rhizophaga]|uniref:Uncharacterized protein n=1 Tax=Clonostachys rhizophaga TaxID=160324 RepID=A0A9N9VY23_9HYPO|nr:unnamed protein product [Clonostachys rhizophaga]